MKIGIVCSTFDLLHPGHVELLRNAKEHCDYLIAALNCDKHGKLKEKGPCVQSVVERYTQLAAVSFVDEVVPYESPDDLRLLLNLRHIDIRFIGDDYIGKDFVGKDICERKGIQVVYNDRQHGLSSSELKRRIRDEKN